MPGSAVRTGRIRNGVTLPRWSRARMNGSCGRGRVRRRLRRGSRHRRWSSRRIGRGSRSCSRSPACGRRGGPRRPSGSSGGVNRLGVRRMRSRRACRRRSRSHTCGPTIGFRPSRTGRWSRRPSVDAFRKDVYAEVRDRYDRRAVAEGRRCPVQPFGPGGVRATPSRRPRRGGAGASAASVDCVRAGVPSREESDVRERVLREHRLEVQGIFLAACQASRRGGALIERQPDRVSAQPPAVEREPPRETVHAVSGTGFDVRAGDHEGGSPSPRPERRPRRKPTEQASPSRVPAQPVMRATVPTSTRTGGDQIGEGDDARDGNREPGGESPRSRPGERRRRRAPADQAPSSSTPATPAMPAAAPQAKRAAVGQGTEEDERDGPGGLHPEPATPRSVSPSSPKRGKDKRRETYLGR